MKARDWPENLVDMFVLYLVQSSEPNVIEVHLYCCRTSGNHGINKPMKKRVLRIDVRIEAFHLPNLSNCFSLPWNRVSPPDR